MNISRTELYTFKHKVVDYIVANSFTLEDLVYNNESVARTRIASEISAIFWQSVGTKNDDFHDLLEDDWD